MVSIDWTSPILNIENKEIKQGGDLNYKINSSDSLSGIKNVFVNNEDFNIDKIENNYYLTKENISAGTYILGISVIDNAGNSITKEMILSVIKENQKIAKQEKVEVDENTTEIIVNQLSSSLKEIIIPENISESKEIKIDFSSIKTSYGNKTNVSALNGFLLRRKANIANYTADISAGTTITGEGWDGKLNLPTVKKSEDFFAENGNVNIVIDLGSGVELNFDKSVKITLGEMAGKKAGWARNSSSLREIKTICNNYTNPTNINSSGPKECYIDSEDGKDLIIWTYHFTSFAAFSPVIITQAQSTDTGGNSNGGCRTEWVCDSWSSCIEGRKTRECYKKIEYCYAGEKPEEEQVCDIVENSQENKENIITQSRITGAFIGTIGTGGSLILIFAILIIFVGLGIILKNKRKNETQKNLEKK